MFHLYEDKDGHSQKIFNVDQKFIPLYSFTTFVFCS